MDGSITWEAWRGCARTSVWHAGWMGQIPRRITWGAEEPHPRRCASMGWVAVSVNGLWCPTTLPTRPSNTGGEEG
jgi:hypothetical protein